jgi:hypothetical protein
VVVSLLWTDGYESLKGEFVFRFGIDPAAEQTYGSLSAWTEQYNDASPLLVTAETDACLGVTTETGEQPFPAGTVYESSNGPCLLYTPAYIGLNAGETAVIRLPEGWAEAEMSLSAGGLLYPAACVPFPEPEAESAILVLGEDPLVLPWSWYWGGTAPAAAVERLAVLETPEAETGSPAWETVSAVGLVTPEGAELPPETEVELWLNVDAETGVPTLMSTGAAPGTYRLTLAWPGSLEIYSAEIVFFVQYDP